jgi:acyl carrier protein
MIEEIKIILEKVKGIPGLSKQLADSADIIEDVELDSLEMLEFMLEVESNLSIEINFEELDFSYLKSIEELSKFLSEQKRVF